MNNYLTIKKIAQLLLFILFFKSSITKVNGQQKEIFVDDFEDNRNFWPVRHDSDFNVSIGEGQLQIKKWGRNKPRRGCLWLSKEVAGFNTAKDFTITFYARVLGYGDIVKGIDMQWGGNVPICDTCSINPPQARQLYQVDFWPDQVRLSYFQTNKAWKYFDKMPAITDPAKRNKYSIKQTGNIVTVEINDVEVYKQKIKVIEGNSIGIQECLKSTWEIDKITILQ